MKLFKSKLFIGILGVIVIFATVSIVIINTPAYGNEKTAFSISNAEKSKLRTHYPAYDNFPPLGSINPDFHITVDTMVKESEIIIIGEVIELTNDLYIDISVEKGTPEAALFEKQAKLGNDVKSTRVQTKIKVLESLKGQEDLKEIIAVQNRIFVNYEPKFKLGMKVVLLLQAGEDALKGKYHSSRYGFFYLTDDNRVVSAISDEDFDRFTGMNLNDFKNEIRKMAK